MNWISFSLIKNACSTKRLINGEIVGEVRELVTFHYKTNKLEKKNVEGEGEGEDRYQ